MKEFDFAVFSDVCALNWEIESSACYQLVRKVYNLLNTCKREKRKITRNRVEIALITALQNYKDKLEKRDFMNDYAYFCDRVLNDCFN